MREVGPLQARLEQKHAERDSSAPRLAHASRVTPSVLLRTAVYPDICVVACNAHRRVKLYAEIDRWQSASLSTPPYLTYFEPSFHIEAGPSASPQRTF
jgi:hypothetical protein